MGPAPGTVEVWIGVAAGDVACCSAAEHRRAASHRDPVAAGIWLAGRSVLRCVLAWAAGVDARDVTFEEGPGGKLYAPDTGLEFNLSHARDIIAVAVAGPEPGPVGIDIELPRRIHRPARLAERLIVDAVEFDRWSALEEDRQAVALLQRWTRHEALLKATGEGIRGGIAGTPERLGALGWHVRDLAFPGEGIGAVAAHGTAWTVRHRTL